MDVKQLFIRTIEKWGRRSQLEMAQEESTELALSIRKYIRKDCPENYLSMASEIADVEIMIEQIKIMFPTINESISEAKIFKLNRLDDRLNNNSFE